MPDKILNFFSKKKVPFNKIYIHRFINLKNIIPHSIRIIKMQTSKLKKIMNFISTILLISNILWEWEYGKFLCNNVKLF